jgi:hypothetical protein
MTLGELKEDLKRLGVRVIGTLRDSPTEEEEGSVVVYFSSDQDIVFPFRPKNVYPLAMKSDADNEYVNSEKVKAIKRSLVPHLS